MTHPTSSIGKHHMRTLLITVLPVSAIAWLLATAGCRTASTQAPTSVEDAWTAPMSFAPRPSLSSAQQTDAGAIAYADGHPIPRSRLIDLLIEGHGVGALEQLLALDAAKRLAQEKGLAITQSDVDAEFDRSLQSLLGDTASGDPEALRRKAAEALLDGVLADRNLGRGEFMLVMRRNAYLRKIVHADLQTNDEQLHEEFARRYGERVEIRHIQLATNAELDKVVALRSAGVDFGELAMRYSSNRQTGERRGLLPIFSAVDGDVPAILRETAFSLTVGQECDPLLVDGWYHLIRVERRIPARNVSFDDVRDDVERSLRRRLADAQMQELYARAFERSDIKIVDPKLRRLFFAKHRDHRSAPKQ